MHHMQTQKHGISKLDFASIVSALLILLIVKRYDVCVCFCFFLMFFFCKNPVPQMESSNATGAVVSVYLFPLFFFLFNLLCSYFQGQSCLCC